MSTGMKPSGQQGGMVVAKPDAAVLATIEGKPGVGMILKTAVQASEYAKILMQMGQAVPPAVRGNYGIAHAICSLAVALEMPAEFLASKAYVVSDRVAFESQLIHAIIEQRAPLSRRLRAKYAGSGDQRTCTVMGWLHGEEEPFEYTSPPIGQITPKGSPLWKTKPDLQLWYNASRDWARMYCPDVILGMYSEDELDRTPRDNVSALLTAAAPGSVQVTSEHAARPEPVAIDSEAQQDTEPAAPEKPSQSDLERLVTAYHGVGVTLGQIEEWLGGDLAESMTAELLDRLRAIYGRVKSGESWAVASGGAIDAQA